MTPSHEPHQVLAEYPDYAQAQRLVDYLSDEGFPVQHVQIVGRGLHSVEQVVGRMTNGKAALAGAASGLWFGVLIGLLMALFTDANFLAVVAGAAVLGAIWGAVFGFAAQAATRGQRDFASVSTVEADTYLVQVQTQVMQQAGELYARYQLKYGR
ncbi:hypothetical protein G9U51_03630 [Calidifontibacter sp. DB0510]|uniref:General stress protein 17M-like domain-containing protein n=1 Tax=Metallococcus carri TaxID=1656884 RepID=A0A967E9H6_9MICO|nr:hypothetical protein [Metallococcus carri]NOP37219.1 hypothetical protein [Calidifontibacter sp. DB2511S]